MSAIPSNTTLTERPDATVSCSHDGDGRNLSLCIDGTANQFSEKNTNVVELYSRMLKDDKKQLTYYNSGIGTYVKPSPLSLSFWKQSLNHAVDMAIAWNFQRIVLSAYQWLSENYQPGDRIFLFGFSRGAYQVRVIAGMIEKVGLLHKGNNDQISFAYELYSAAIKESSGVRNVPQNIRRLFKNIVGKVDHDIAEDSKAEKLCKAFKSALSRPNVKIHFVGAWDTVSSIGITRGASLPETTNGMHHVCHFRHALALDEKRVKFLPEYANGGAGPEAGQGGDIKEVWFAGSHSDIGGGTVLNVDLNQFGPALRWMTYEAVSHGLKMNPYQGDWSTFTPTKSLTFLWKPIEILPFRRLSYTGPEDTTHQPNMGRPRRIQAGQLVHRSVLEAMTARGYVPKARLWNRSTPITRDDLTKSTLVEGDPYASANDILTELRQVTVGDALSAQIDALARLASPLEYQPLIEHPEAVDGIMQSLTSQFSNAGNSRGPRERLVELLVGALKACSSHPRHGKRHPPSRFLALQAGIGTHYPRHADAINEAIKELSLTYLLGVYNIHRSYVRSIRFSDSGSQVYSAAGRHSGWAIWDAESGAKINKGQYTDCIDVSCATFSPEGKKIAVGLKDGSVWIFSVFNADGEENPRTMASHNGQVHGVTFSHDGQRLASCSDDGKVKVSTLTTSETREYTNSRPLFCVAFSPDDVYIAAGSKDGFASVWDIQTGEHLRTLRGHRGRILSLSFSHDGTRILTSSKDATLRIWDAASGKHVSMLEGHRDLIPAAAFSKDDKLVASGSYDKTVKIWDAATGEVLRSFDVGSSVTSLAFSPNGSRIVSGTRFGIHHVWESDLYHELSSHTGS